MESRILYGKALRCSTGATRDEDGGRMSTENLLATATVMSMYEVRLSYFCGTVMIPE